jgi:hypothetical protein
MRQVEADESAQDFLEALYGDPLRAETLRTGRQLVIASIICIAVVIFKVRLQSTSLVPLDFGDRIEVLPMLLSLAVLLLLLSFSLRAVTDLLRDRETAVLVTRYIERQRTEAAKAAAKGQDDAIEQAEYEARGEGDSDPDPWWEPYYEIKEAADSAVSVAEERVGIRRWPRHVRRLHQWLEVGVPGALAAIALFVPKASLAAFATALILALKPY